MIWAIVFQSCLLSATPDMDFDLLGKVEPPPAPVDAGAVSRRRGMLVAHQLFGIGLVAAMATTMITGQLNYLDRFAGPSSARFELAHKVASYTTLTIFTGSGALALFAPSPMRKESTGFDRITLHRASLLATAVGMVSQLVLGVVTVAREGYVNQADMALAHLAVGYTTLAFMLVGVGALIF